jgi:hypothetical protein
MKTLLSASGNRRCHRYWSIYGTATDWLVRKSAAATGLSSVETQVAARKLSFDHKS